MNIFHQEYKTSDPPIRVSYHDGNHYNAVIDPLVPTAGLGLGLPGLKPGLADQLQVTKAKQESDQLADQMELERILQESKADFKDSQDDQLQRVLKESSMDYVRMQTGTFRTEAQQFVFRCTNKNPWRLPIWTKRIMNWNKRHSPCRSNQLNVRTANNGHVDGHLPSLPRPRLVSLRPPPCRETKTPHPHRLQPNTPKSFKSSP